MKKAVWFLLVLVVLNCSPFHTPVRAYRLEKTDGMWNEYNAYFNDLKHRRELKEISDEDWKDIQEVAKQALENIMAAYQDLSRGFSCPDCYDDHMTKAGYRVAILKWQTLIRK